MALRPEVQAARKMTADCNRMCSAIPAEARRQEATPTLPAVMESRDGSEPTEEVVGQPKEAGSDDEMPAVE